MREIGVGIRIDISEGLSFSGIEEVNALIICGGKVTSIEPVGAVMRKLGDDCENVRLTLSGCEMKVIVDDSGVDSSPESIEHNRLYQLGNELIAPYLQLVNRKSESTDSQQAMANLDRGIAILRQALSINPANWAAYWIIGKAYQSLSKSEQACEAFGKSYGLQKGNADVAREYMFECLKLGRTDKAIAAARHSVALKPNDAGLVANLALALLIGAKLDEAAETIARALTLSPNDEISHSLKNRIRDVQTGRKPQPNSLVDLDAT